MARILVIGLGNVLLGDEALGPEVVALLESRYLLPDGVEALEIGTQGLDLVPFISGCEVLVVVGSLHGKGRPGEVRVLDREAVMRNDAEYRMSPHAFGLRGHLLTLEFGGGAPREVVVVGAIPEDVELRSGLTPALKGAVPAVLEALVQVLSRLGAAPALRPEPLPLRLWWDETAGSQPGG
ncbi:MAG: hydrogenase maturation protease [Deltaproteobacteria bacterium]|nr:hydrogenase maturation protease [Deltaproteobacteria bacterium]